MPTASTFIVLLIASVFSTTLSAQPLNNAKLKMLENQRNLITLRGEKRYYQDELSELVLRNPADETTIALIDDVQESITIAEEIINNVSATVSRQRLLITTLEKGTPPRSLDIALSKALSSNLTEITKGLGDNEAAQKEIALLRSLLKQEARIGISKRASRTEIDVAEEQQVAEVEFLNLLALFSSGGADESEDKALRISVQTKNESFSEGTVLSYLGHNQYHTETTVYSGNMTFTVDGKPWRLTIPDDEDNAIYIIIYDLRNQAKPRMVMFNKTLLLE